MAEDLRTQPAILWNPQGRVRLGGDPSKLEALGPNVVSAWNDLSNSGILCTRCQFTPWEEFYLQTVGTASKPTGVVWSEDAGPTIMELRTSAQSGCHLCTLILSHMIIQRTNIQLRIQEGTTVASHVVKARLHDSDRVFVSISRDQVYDEESYWRTLNIRVGRYATEGKSRVQAWNDLIHVTLEITDKFETAVHTSSGSQARHGDKGLENLQETSIHEETLTDERAAEIGSGERLYLEPNLDDLVSERCHAEESDNGVEILLGHVHEDQNPPAKPRGITLSDILEEKSKSVDGISTAQDIASDTSSVIENNIPPIDFSADAEDIARYWLCDCLTNHNCSSDKLKNPILPTRVIDLEGNRATGQPCLVHSNGFRGQYAAMSYCWGSQNHAFVTTHRNMEQRSRNIPLHMLPKTFQDGIRLTRALGIRYLWIDAICILQDSREDCQRELGQMADIYANATLTVAAIGSNRADGGCAPMRNKLAMQDCKISPNLKVTGQSEAQYRSLRRGTIHDRAWCMQEAEISPRLLSVGASEIFWQCRLGFRRESVPTELVYGHPYTLRYVGNVVYEDASGYDTREYQGIDIRRFQWAPEKRILDLGQVFDLETVFRRWYGLVQKYVTRDLTLQTDKLDAVSALAKTFASLFTGEETRLRPQDYLCGLWRQDLLQGLLWHNSDPEVAPRPLFRAPSWTWAGCDMKIIHFAYLSDPDGLSGMDFKSEILDASVEVVSELNPFGAVKSGKLTVLGQVARMPDTIRRKIYYFGRELIPSSQRLFPPAPNIDEFEDSDDEYVVSYKRADDRKSVGEDSLDDLPILHRGDSLDDILEPEPLSAVDGGSPVLFHEDNSVDLIENRTSSTDHRRSHSTDDSRLSSPDSERPPSENSNTTPPWNSRSVWPVTGHFADITLPPYILFPESSWHPNIWMENPDAVSWDNVHTAEDAAAGYQCLRMTKNIAIILCPVGSPKLSGIYQRVGIINLSDTVYMGRKCASEESFRRRQSKLMEEFEAFEWQDNVVVTMI